MRLWLALPALLVAVAVSGCCVRVHPWQRENLARIESQLGKSGSHRAYESHMWMVREGSVGGSGQAGGGCGCN